MLKKLLRFLFSPTGWNPSRRTQVIVNRHAREISKGLSQGRKDFQVGPKENSFRVIVLDDDK